VVVGITAAAGALRFATLTSQSYWSDEAATAHEMQLSLGAMLHQSRADVRRAVVTYGARTMRGRSPSTSAARRGKRRTTRA